MSVRELEYNVKEVNLYKLSAEDKKNALAFNNLGHRKYMEVNFEDAVEDYTKALELDESLAVAYYNRGTIFYRMGSFQKAHEDLERAVSLDQMNEEFKKGLEACKKCYSAPAL